MLMLANFCEKNTALQVPSPGSAYFEVNTRFPIPAQSGMTEAMYAMSEATDDKMSNLFDAYAILEGKHCLSHGGGTAGGHATITVNNTNCSSNIDDTLPSKVEEGSFIASGSTGLEHNQSDSAVKEGDCTL